MMVLMIASSRVITYRFETSAKENINIDAAAKFLVNEILKLDVRRPPRNEDTVNIREYSEKPEDKGCSC